MVTGLDHAHHFAREAYVKELQKSVEQFSKDKALEDECMKSNNQHVCMQYTQYTMI